MRLFVSVDLPAELADPIVDVQADLAEASGISPTDPDHAHVTLKFLGDVDADRLPTLREELAAAVEDAGVNPFTARYAGLGVFPDLDYISVVWVGVEAGSDQLTALHEAIEARTTAMGFEAESHSFTPHVTVARMTHAGGKAHVQTVVRDRTPSIGEMRVSEIRLTESTLTPEGPVYSTVDRFPIG